MYGRCGSFWRSGVSAPFIGAGFPWGRGGRWGRFFGPGEIRMALLSMLESGPKHGYELMKELESKSNGVYRASAGAIYPALQQLEDEGLVTSDQSQGKRVYALSEAGRAEVQREAESIKRIWFRAQDAGGWGIGPEGAEMARPAVALMKAAIRASREHWHDAAKMNRIHEILNRATKEIEAVEKS